MSDGPKKLSFFDHLEELRFRIIKCLAAFLIASVVFSRYLDPILAFIIEPIGRLVFTYPSEAFLARIALICWGGLIVSFPYILYELWQFVSLGLTAKEKRYILFFGPVSLIFFVLGAVFGYLVMVPMSMQFFLGFASDWMIPMITVNQYVSYVGNMIFAFGIVFELPVVLLFLTKIGIATPAFLTQKRPYMIVGIFIVSAVLTPPDIASQLLMAVPLLVLYEIGVVVAKIVYRFKDH